MAKIVGPMIILIEEEKSPNFGESDMQENLLSYGAGRSPFSKNGTKVNLALTSEKIYLLNDLQEMRAEMVMDIAFATFKESVPSMAAAFCKSKGGIVPDISKNEETKVAEEN
jgi:putative hemolysin